MTFSSGLTGTCVVGTGFPPPPLESKVPTSLTPALPLQKSPKHHWPVSDKTAFACFVFVFVFFKSDLDYRKRERESQRERERAESLSCCQGTQAIGVAWDSSQSPEILHPYPVPLGDKLRPQTIVFRWTDAHRRQLRSCF